MKKLVIRFNAPVVLLFALLSLLIYGLTKRYVYPHKEKCV